MGIPKGTKLTDTPKNITLKVRFDVETERRLNVICDKTKKSKAQIIRDGINELYAKIK